MCFRGGRPVILPTPAPIQPRVANEQARSQPLPKEKDLLDPTEATDVAFGASRKKTGPGGAKRTGTAALTIPLNTGTGTAGTNSGGLNV